MGTGNAVRITGKPDGYFRNEAIKIPMPAQLRTIDKGLRRVGYGRQVDDFILSMNRAAERAAPVAKDIFWNAIRQLTFDDVRHILSGGDSAATEYFRHKTSAELTVAFRPVDQSMNGSGYSPVPGFDEAGQIRALRSHPDAGHQGTSWRAGRALPCPGRGRDPDGPGGVTSLLKEVFRDRASR